MVTLHAGSVCVEHGHRHVSGVAREEVMYNFFFQIFTILLNQINYFYENIDNLISNFPTCKVSTTQYAIFWHTNLLLNPTQVPYIQHVKSQTRF
jgi:hypothetical protein